MKIGITDAEWRDDLESLADWFAWLKSIEPFEITPEEQAEFDRYNEVFVRFNLAAVWKQMESEPMPSRPSRFCRFLFWLTDRVVPESD